jgi:hypothetical protein
MIALAGIAIGCASTPAATDRPTGTALDGLDVAGDPDVTLVGEAFLDLAWPSEYRDGCLTIHDGTGHVEIVSEEPWTARRDEAGWFEIADGAGTVVAREHRVVTVRGAFLDSQGCREGRLFRVDEITPLVASGAATLHVEVVLPDGPVFVEGSVNVVRVLVDGEPAFQEPVASGQSIAVPAGPIRVVDFQKACNGNCQEAYGSELECEVALDLAPGSAATLRVTLVADGCSSEVTTDRAAGLRAALSGAAGP